MHYLGFRLYDDIEGFIKSVSGDWAFIHWTELDRRGLVSTEQILLFRSLEVLGEPWLNEDQRN